MCFLLDIEKEAPMSKAGRGVLEIASDTIHEGLSLPLECVQVFSETERNTQALEKKEGGLRKERSNDEAKFKYYRGFTAEKNKGDPGYISRREGLKGEQKAAIYFNGEITDSNVC